MAVLQNLVNGANDRQLSSSSVQALDTFRKQMLGKYSKSRYNGMMQNLRALFDEAVAAGALPKNPCRDLGFKFRTLKVPTDKDFEDLCAELLSMKNGSGKWVVQSVRLLAMTGAGSSTPRCS